MANLKETLKLHPGSRWEGNWIIGPHWTTVSCLPTLSLAFGASKATPVMMLDTGDSRRCVATDALAAIRLVGADPEYLELLKARAEIERLKEQVAGYQAKLAVLEGLR